MERFEDENDLKLKWEKVKVLRALNWEQTRYAVLDAWEELMVDFKIGRAKDIMFLWFY